MKHFYAYVLDFYGFPNIYKSINIFSCVNGTKNLYTVSESWQIGISNVVHEIFVTVIERGKVQILFEILIKKRAAN